MPSYDIEGIGGGRAGLQAGGNQVGEPRQNSGDRPLLETCSGLSSQAPPDHEKQHRRDSSEHWSAAEQGDRDHKEHRRCG